MPNVLVRSTELGQSLRNAGAMPIAKNVLMIRPTHFNIEVAINPHMRAADGSMHALDTKKAMAQWDNLKSTYERIGLKVTVLDGAEGLPDMCFAANQSLPYLDENQKKRALLSNMANDTRHKEVKFVGEILTKQGYETESFPIRNQDTLFEGMGDALWLPGKKFLLGGYGHRTSKEMYSEVAKKTGADVAVFQLKNPRFYHLDTCLAILSETAALAHKDAFTPEGWQLLKAIFPTIIEVPLNEADSPRFACNAHCPDSRHVIIQSGSLHTNDMLVKSGYTVIETDTSEFIKSGGSVFCLKLMFF